MKFNPFDGIPKPGSGTTAGGGVICTFAFELFFIVALFLFLMFLPIVVFAFQLWWMLALRFCLVRLDAQFTVVTQFLVKAHLDFAGELAADVQASAAMNAIMGVRVPPGSGQDGIAASLKLSKNFEAHFNNRTDLEALVSSVDPALAVAPTEPAHEPKPKDPLCPGS